MTPDHAKVRFLWAKDPTHSDDLRFILGEMAKATNALGFIPRAGVERHAKRKRAAIVERNDDRLGYAIFSLSRQRPTVTINQCYVRADARLIEHGRALVSALREKWPHRRLQCSCAADLAAVIFWSQLGFTRAGVRTRANARGRAIIEFKLPALVPDPELFPTHEEAEFVSLQLGFGTECHNA